MTQSLSCIIPLFFRCVTTGVILCSAIVPAFAQSSTALGVKDAAEISYKSELVVNELRDLLNIISSSQTDSKEMKDLIFNSYSGEKNRIFENGETLIEDDIIATEVDMNNPKEVHISKYLNDFDLIYTKSDTTSVTFKIHKISSLKQGDYLYTKVYFTPLYNNRPSHLIAQDFIRVSEIKAKKNGGKWNTHIARIAYCRWHDTADSQLNNAEIVYSAEQAKQEGTGASDAPGFNYHQLIAEEKQAQLMMDQENSKYLQVIKKGNDALENKDFALALSHFSEASALQPYELLPKVKINQIRKLIDQSSVSAEEISRQLTLQAKIAETAYDYEKAKDFYVQAVKKNPSLEPQLQSKVRELTQKIRVSTELEEKYVAGKYKDAINDYDRAIKNDSKNPTFYVGRGKCYEKTEDGKRALRDYSKAIELDNQYMTPLQLRAELYASKNEYFKAITDYKILSTLDASNESVLMRMFELHLLAKNINAAFEDLNKAIEINSSNAYTFFRRGQLYYQNSEVVKALDDLTHSISLNAKDPDAFYFRALCQLKLKQISEGGLDFETARNLQLRDEYRRNIENIADSTYTAALVLLNEKRYAQASLLFDQAITINPAVAGYYFQRGETEYLTGNFTPAIEFYTKAINRNSSYHEAFHKRGLSWFYSNDYKQAISDFDQSAALFATNPAVYEKKGEACFKLSMYKEALESFETGLTRARSIKKPFEDSLLTNIYNYMGQSEFHLSNYEKAKELFRTSLQYGKTPEVYYYRGVSYMKLKQLQDAEEDLLKAVSYNDSSVLWLYALSDVYDQKKQLEQCVKYLSETMKYDSAHKYYSDALLRRGRLNFQLEHYPETLNDYGELLGIYPEKADKDFYFERGVAYLHASNNADSAVISLKNYLEMVPGDPKAQFYLGAAFTIKEDFDQALIWFEKSFQSGTIRNSFVKKSTFTDKIKADKRFKALAKKYL